MTNELANALTQLVRTINFILVMGIIFSVLYICVPLPKKSEENEKESNIK